MKIVMIGQKGIPSQFGGVETHVAELSTRLARAGHDVLVYGRRWYCDRKLDRYNGVNVKILPSIRTKHLDAISHTLFSTVHACLFARPDVIHFHGVGPSLLAWLPKILRPSAVVVTTFHCLDREHDKWNFVAKWFLKLGERACLKFSDATIATSRVLCKYIYKNYGERVNYLPNGITPRRVTIDSAVLDSFGLRSHGYVAMVARLVRHKGAHTLIEAWQLARVKEPQLFKDLKLAIVGGSAFTDDYVSELKHQASGDASIVFTDFQRGETLSTLFAGARFVVHPSVAEGLPIAVIEAMSYGKAVIAANIPENLELVKDHGISFKAGSAKQLAKKMIELAQDPMQAASIGHAAREFVESEYHWDDIGRATIEIYQKQLAVSEGVLAIQ
jgi:glycosyltransferase involved in cell wall biosynthesis